MNLMDLAAALKMDVSDFVRGKDLAKGGMLELQSAAAQTASSVSAAGTSMGGITTAASSAASSVGDLNNEVTSATSSITNFASSAASAGAALTAGLTLPIVGLIAEALRMAGAFEQAQIGFSTMMGSGTQAQQFLNELKNFAATTPFEFPDLQRAAQKLMAMGFAAQAVIPIMTAIGDAVAAVGGGAELVNRVTLALGQMNAKGKVSAQEMNQLAEAGIPAWNMLAHAIGVTIPQAMKMAEQGAISSAVAIPAILEGIEARFAGMMQAQNRTLAGQWSNFKDQISFILADIGAALIPFAQAILQAATPILDLLRSMVEGFRAMPEPVQAGALAMAALAAAIGPALIAFAGLSAAVSAVGTLLGVTGIGAIITTLAGPIAAVTAGVVALVAAWELWHLDSVQSAVSSFQGVLSDFWTSTLRPMVETVAAAGLAFVNFAGSVISSGLESAWSAIQSAGSAMWAVLVQIGETLSPVGAAFGEVITAAQPLIEIIGEILGALGQLVAVIVTGGLIASWEGFKEAIGLVWSALQPLGSFLVDVLVAGLRLTAEAVRDASLVIAQTLKSAIEIANTAIREFVGYIQQIPGVKSAIEAVGGAFTTMKTAIVGAVDSSRGSVQAFSTTSTSSMQAARTAFLAAQQAYDQVATAFRNGKATAEQLKTATDNLATAHNRYSSELSASQPKITATQQAVRSAQQEFDAAKRNVDAVTAAFNNNKASANDLVNAQQRMKDAQITLNSATAEQKRVAAETGVEMNNYSGSVKSVRDSLADHNVHAQTAKEKNEALKAAVDQARLGFIAAFEAYRNGTGSIDAVRAAFENMKAQQDNMHPERAAEAFLKARDDEKNKAEANMRWFEETYIPKWNQVADQFEQQSIRMSATFGREHDKIVAAAQRQIVIDVKITDRLPGDVNDAIQAAKQIDDAYKTLGIHSAEYLAEKARKAQEAYATIKVSGQGTARDIEAAELAALRATLEAQRAYGNDATKEQRDRLKTLEDDLKASTTRQGTIWTDLGKDLKRIGEGINRDLAGAMVDLFEGKGWKGFKDAAIGALESAGQALAKFALEQVEGLLIKSLKSIITDHLPGLVNAFKSLGSFLLDVFKDVGSAITGAVSGGVNAVSNAVGGGSSAVGSAGGAVGTAGSVAGGVAGGLTGIVGAVAGVATAISSVIGNFQMAKMETTLNAIEESTRYVKIDFHGRFMDMVNQYYPKLDLDNFHYGVLIPALNEISDETRGKGLLFHGELILVKDVIVQTKDLVVDLINKAVETNNTLTSIYTAMTTVAAASATTATNSAEFDTTQVETNIANMQSALSGALTGVVNAVSGLSGSFGNSLTGVVNAISGLSGSFGNSLTGIANAISNADPRNSINTGFANLQNALSYLQQLPSSLSTMSSQPRASNTYQYITINGFAVNQSLAAVLRSYGVPI